MENKGKFEVAIPPSFSPLNSFSPPFCSPTLSFFLCSIMATSSSPAASNSDALNSKLHCVISSRRRNASKRSCVACFSSSAFLSNSFLSISNRCFSISASFFSCAAMTFFLRRIDDVVDDTFEAESPGFTLSFSSSSFLSLSSLTPPIAPPALVRAPEVATVNDGVR